MADQQALQAGVALARQQLSSAALSDVCRSEAAKALALQFNVGGIAPLGNQIGNLINADLQRIQQITAGFNAIRAMHPLLEAEEERRQRLAEIVNPCRGLIESLRIQSSGLDRIAESYQASLRQMAEAVVPRFPAIDCGIGLDAISTLASFGDLGLSDLHVPVRIHAVPRLATQNVLCPGRSREAFLDRQPLSPILEAPPHREPTGWPEDSLEDEGGRRVLEQLSRFVRSEEIPSDAREGMDFLLALWKLKKTGLSKTERHRLHLTVVAFLREQIGVLPPAGGLQQLASGLLVPHTHGKTLAPDLDPEIFTTQQLAKKLPSTTDTLKRHAKKACEIGPLPQPMPAFPGWFVVAQSDPKGGQGCGWKFQQRRALEEC